MDAPAYLRRLCEDALPQRYPDGGAAVRERLEHELGIITRAGLANYFLIVWDIVRFAREQGILCQGRGSAANSLVAYLLGITPVDPLAHHLVFERFLSDERRIAPDIDIDFQADRREEVIQYVYQNYGTGPRGDGLHVGHLPDAERRPRCGQGAGPAAERARVRWPMTPTAGAANATTRFTASLSSCASRSRAFRATWVFTTAAWSSPGR